MRLSDARLCLDCDEVHGDAQCPVCASESFAFIKRWVTTPETRTRPAAAGQANSNAVVTYRALLATNGDSRVTTRQLLRSGAIGLALLGTGWLLQRNARKKSPTVSPAPQDQVGGASVR